MGVTCQIFIRRPSEGVHKAGKAVTGIVKYQVDEPEEYKDIILSLVGKGICCWKESRQTAKGRESVAYIGTEEYTSQYKSIYNKISAQTSILPIGTYEYDFRFLLPKDVPPSFENNLCSIKYKLLLKFEKPNYFSIHKTFGTEISVYSYVKAPVEGTVFELKKTLFKPFKKRIHQVKLKAEISKTIFSAGQKAELTYVVTNDTDITIPSVKTELICYTTYTANCGKRKATETIIKECTVETPSIPDNAVANMANTVSILANLYSIQSCRIMVKNYKLKVTVRLPMPHLNVFLEIPIAIGEIYGVHDVKRSVQEIDGEPPSYFEVMNEDRENNLYD